MTTLTFLVVMIITLMVLVYQRLGQNHRRRLNDRQHEIERLAEDNRDYRTQLLNFLDHRLDIK